MATDAWTHLGFARVATLLGERAGLRFPPSRQPSTEQAFRRAMAHLGVRDPYLLARRLQHDERALDRLLAEVTIGETYFFREPAQFAYLRRHVLPELASKRSAARPLRLWSAACATGEEPYTLAMVLSEERLARRASVLGTDVSGPRLEAARRARYTRWSLRGVTEPVVERWFVRQGTEYWLRPAIRDAVEFHELNLATDPYPSSVDVLFCRNVLIYFDRASVAQVAQRLLDALSADGWLFLGASDPALQGLVPCEVVVTGGGVAYRRVGAGGAARPSVAGAPVAPVAAPPPGPSAVSAEPEWALLARASDDGAPAAAPTGAPPPSTAPEPLTTEPALARAAQSYAERDYVTAAIAARGALNAPAAPELGDAPWILLVRALANLGQLADADRACLEGLEHHRASAELTYLHAVLLLQAGHGAAAVAAARRALYLDRTLAVAHLTLGAALAREGHREQARAAYRSAERLLAAYPPGGIVPASDGETARRLLEAARAQVRQLGGAAA